MQVAVQAMTPLDNVFMLKSDEILNYETMKRIADTGHSRVPVYDEIEVPVISEDGKVGKTNIVKKIIGVLMVKQVGGIENLMQDPQY